MLTVVIALISFAIAFVCGGVLSKAYFATRDPSDAVGRKKLHELLQAQRVRYRKRMAALNNVIRRHEETRDQIRDKLSKIEDKRTEHTNLLHKAQSELEQEQQKNQDLCQQLAGHGPNTAEPKPDKSATSGIEKELSLLRIERDELAARASRLEANQVRVGTASESGDSEDKIAQMRAEMGELRETLATRDRRIHDLELQLQDSTERTRELQAKLDNWKHRVTPLTRKLKQQKEVIRKFCQNEEAEQPSEKPGDDLKVIRGIGPALERRLQQYGIRHYHQIATMSVDELAGIAQKLGIAPNLAERDAWIQQARDLQNQPELPQTA